MKIPFPFNRFHFKERKEDILVDLEKRERKIKEKWLTKSYGYQLICNQDEKWKFKDFEYSWIRKILKNSVFCIFTGGIPFFFFIWKKKRKANCLSTLRELQDIDKRKREILDAQEYFQRIEDSEQSFRESKERELEPWSERIVSFSLSTIPYSKYEEERNKTRDSYMKFLHAYTFCISLVLTGGLIIFYILYRKFKDPRYTFLESAINKHIIEKTKFEAMLQDLIRKKYGFDVLDNLTHSFSKTLQDITTESHLRTKFFSTSGGKIIFYLLMTFLTAGIFPLYNYWLLLKKNRSNSKKAFYTKWIKRKKQEKEIATPLTIFKRGTIGRSCLYFKKVWIDWYFSTFMASVTNRAITSNFFKPRRKLDNLNWSLMWMFTTPLTKWIINLSLLIMTYTFLLIWSFSFSFAVGAWPFYAVIISGAAFLLLLGYHILLII